MSEIGLYEAMRTLRAVRRLRPDPVPDEALRRALEAATFAPTGGNVQPWRAIVVRERGLLAQLGALYAERWAAYAQQHRQLLRGAPPDAALRAQKMLASGDFLAAHFGETPALVIFCFDPTRMAITDAKLARVSVVGGASVYPSVQNFLLGCRAEGLGCVLTTLLCEVEPQVRALLAIPEPWATACAIPVGWPLARGHGPLARRPLAKMAFADRFGNPLA